MYAYAVYIYGVPIVATVDFDAPDQALIQEGGSRWLRQNAVYLRLEEGETFFEEGLPPTLPAATSLFARRLRQRLGGTSPQRLRRKGSE